MYFRLLPEIYLTLGKNKSLLQNIVKNKSLLINSKLLYIIKKCENNYPIDEKSLHYLKKLENNGWGKITEKPVFVDKLRLTNVFNEKKFHKDIPLINSAIIKLTNICNESCDFCGNIFCPTCFKSKNNNDVLTLNEWKEVINKLKSYGCKSITLTGGEAYLSPHFFELYEYILKMNVKVAINTIDILNDLSLKIKSGETYGLVGPNGAGKTTFIRTLLGIYEISSGYITVDGINPMDKNFPNIKEKIGCVMDHLCFYKDLSAWENIEFFYRIYFPKAKKDVRNKDIEEIFKKVGIFQKKDEKITFFSKGQKQRLAIARALITKPKLLVLDEPTTGLDVEGTIVLREILQNIKKDGATILISSHNLDELQRLCDKYGFIKDGKIIEEATLSELKEKYKVTVSSISDLELIYKKIFNI